MSSIVSLAALPAESSHAVGILAQLSDECKAYRKAMKSKKTVIDAKEAQLIESLQSNSADSITTQDGREFIVTYTKKKPSIAKKDFFLEATEAFWSSLSDLDKNSMTPDVFSAKLNDSIQELRKSQEQQVPKLREKGRGTKRKRADDGVAGFSAADAAGGKFPQTSASSIIMSLIEEE